MIERQRLDFIRHNQRALRMECYQGIVDHVENNILNEANIVHLGTAVILPATYIGSPRCLQQLNQDSMAIYRKVGKPDFFHYYDLQSKVARDNQDLGKILC